MTSCVPVMFSTHSDQPAREALVTRHSDGTDLSAKPRSFRDAPPSPTG